MERRNSRLVDPNYSLRSILTIHRSSCGKSSFLVPRILRWLPMSEGKWLFENRERGGEKRKGCRWKLKLAPAGCKIGELLGASLIAKCISPGYFLSFFYFFPPPLIRLPLLVGTFTSISIINYLSFVENWASMHVTWTVIGFSWNFCEFEFKNRKLNVENLMWILEIYARN